MIPRSKILNKYKELRLLGYNQASIARKLNELGLYPRKPWKINTLPGGSEVCSSLSHFVNYKKKKVKPSNPKPQVKQVKKQSTSASFDTLILEIMSTNLPDTDKRRILRGLL